MKGILVTEWTSFDRLSLMDLPEPELGDNEVRLRVQAAGISFATSLVVAGRYQRKPPLPFIPGTEVAGIIVEKGATVSRFKVGERVCAVIDWGALAEVAVAKEVNVFALPDALQFTSATAFTNSYATSCAALTWPNLLGVTSGDWLLVHGAAGGVGIAAVEIGNILGATVIATAGNDEKLKVARRHGADHAINYREENFRDEVLRLTDGRGADAVFDPVGGDTFLQSLRCIAPEGRILPVGFAGGDIPQIPANHLLIKNITVCGLNMGLFYGWSPKDMRYEYEDRMRNNMQQLFDWFREGRINPLIHKTFPIECFREAMDEVISRRATGRVAVVMDEEARRLGHG